MRNVVSIRENGTKQVQSFTDGASLTEQSHEGTLSIKQMVERSTRTGTMPMTSRIARYGDWTGITSYHDAQNMVADAQREFMRLPSGIRRRFDNDPAKLLEFLEDEENRPEAIELGLVAAAAPEVPEAEKSQPEAPVEPVAPEPE